MDESLTAAIAERRTRTFIVTTASANQVKLTGTATDLYSPCPQCSTADEQDHRTVVVYRVDNLDMPFWLTLEVHDCTGGHTAMIERGTSALIRPLHRGYVLPSNAVDPPDLTVHAFQIRGLDSWQRTLIAGPETEADRNCAACRRPYGCTHYEILGISCAVSLHPIVIRWCSGCSDASVVAFQVDSYIEVAADDLSGMPPPPATTMRTSTETPPQPGKP